MILLIDNYDSFTWNLYQALALRGIPVQVHRNDARSAQSFLGLEPSAVVISPGPGHPQEAGCTPELIASLPDAIPLLGICLGHQALCQHYGATLEIDPVPTHGKSSPVRHEECTLMRDLESPLVVGRYHSLRAVASTVAPPLRACAWTDDGIVMAVEHQSLPRFGLQFHPESILTPQGQSIIDRFVAITQEHQS